MDPEFLNYTKSKNNDLSSVVKPGDKWCLCNIVGMKHIKMDKPKVQKATNNRTKIIKKYS